MVWSTDNSICNYDMDNIMRTVYPDFDIRSSRALRDPEDKTDIWWHISYLTTVRFQYRKVWYSQVFARYMKFREDEDLDKVVETTKIIKELTQQVFFFKEFQKPNKAYIKLLHLTPDKDQSSEKDRLHRQYPYLKPKK